MDDAFTACNAAPHLVGDPVDTLTGAVVDLKLEFRLVGPLELGWMRHYDSSQHQRSFSLGWGHAHGYDRRLRFEGEHLVYEGVLGERLEYPVPRSDGERIARHGHFLERISARQYLLHRHAEPSMGFEFAHASQPARLALLFRGSHQIRLNYSADGLLEGIVDSVGRRIEAVESADGRLHRLTLLGDRDQADELLVEYRYDGDGNLQSTRNAAGHGYHFCYDDQHRLLSSTGRKGFRFQYSYDEQGRCVVSMGEDRLYGVALNFAAPGRQTVVTRPDHGVWRYSFDPAGRLTQIQDAMGGVRSFVRDQAGRVVFELDPNKALTQIRYDEAGAPVARITPYGDRIPLPENPNDPDPRIARVAGSAAEFEYGSLLDNAAPSLPPAELLAAAELPPAVAALVVLAPAKGTVPASTPYRVDPLGALWWPEPAVGRVFKHLGKLVAQHDDFGRERRWRYDASGNMVEYLDFDGGLWTQDTGKWHLPLCRSNPLHATLRWTHTHAGKVATFIDAGGTKTEFRRDLNDRLVEVRRDGVVRDHYELDPAGNLLAKRTAGGRELLRQQIGPLNLPLEVLLSSGDRHSFKYDERGRCIAAQTMSDHLSFAYDENGHRVRDMRNDEGVEHDYRGGNWPVKTVLFGHFTLRCVLSPGRVTITDPTGQSQQLRFFGHGLVQRQFSNGTHETSQHDVRGRCLFKAAQHPSGHLWTRRYHWSGEGELRRVEDSAAGWVEHEYDAAHRLLRRRDDRGTQAFAFDMADNLLMQPGLLDVELDGNRLVRANGWRYAYDDRHHVAVRQAADAELHYRYDSLDMLVGIEGLQSPWGAEYDTEGRRCRKTWRGETTSFHWNGDQLAAEVAPDGRLRIYVYADPLALTPLMFVDYPSIDADPASGLRRFVFTDQIGTPCLVEDDRGTVLWRASVQPFGSAQVSSPSGLEFNFRFPGHYLDVETGLHYNRFRYYDPLLGRYLQSDPWGIAGGPNVHAYRTNPLLKVDVRGLGEDGGENCPQPEKKKEGDGEPTPPGRRRMTDAELQAAADHIRMGNGDYKPGGGGKGETGDYHTVTVTEGMVNGKPVYTVTTSKAGGLTPRQKNRAAEVFGPEVDIPKQDPRVTGTPDGHSEVRGMNATKDQEDRRQATSNITPSTKADPDVPHMGAACSNCANCQRSAKNSQGGENRVTNVTGTVEDGGRTNNPNPSEWKDWSNENR